MRVRERGEVRARRLLGESRAVITDLFQRALHGLQRQRRGDLQQRLRRNESHLNLSGERRQCLAHPIDAPFAVHAVDAEYLLHPSLSQGNRKHPMLD